MKVFDAIQAGVPRVSQLTQAEPINKNNSSQFKDLLTNAIQQVNEQQIESRKLTEKLITGEVTDLHEVMIAAEKASISLNLTVQVRNKVVEAYQEIMRMQV